MRNHSQQEEDAEINMTPMLDIVFIMLIFFIVTAVFVKDSGIEVFKPETKSAISQKNVSILIAINDKDEIWLNRNKVELEGLRTAVERLHTENPKGSIAIQADMEADAALALKVYDAIRDAGVERIAFATKRK